MLNETPTLTSDGQPYRLLTLYNNTGMVVTLMNRGATLLSASIPLSDGSVHGALPDCASPECYQDQTVFLGASIGCYVNRIANSRYTFDSETVTPSPGRGANQLHGGPEGFDKHRWQTVNQDDRQVPSALSSGDNDQGLPGNLGTTVQYRLTDDNRISTTYRATVDKPCPVNMTSYVYFNLDGEQLGTHNRKLQILTDGYLLVDEGSIPHGGLKSAAGAFLDFRNAKIITSEFLVDDDQRKVKDHDHVLLLQAKDDDKKVAAYVWSAGEKLQLEVYATAPAL